MKTIYSIVLSSILIAFLSSAIATAFAQNEYMYSIKFVYIPTVGLDKDSVFVPQNYSTVVNVHNTYNGSIDFSKKAVIAQSQDEEREQISVPKSDFLKLDEALSINCNDILNLFNNAPSTIGDGFIVLKTNVKLDASAVYTTQSSIDVEYIQPKM
jgi:hypothetical protein